MMNSKFPETITAEEIQDYDLSWFRGRIVLVDNLTVFNKIMPELRRERILGFDTETKPSFRKGHRNKVSLLQLSGRDFACLFRLNRIGLPEELARLLADPGVIKAGVAIHDDIKVLAKIRKFNPEGFVDLQKYVRDFGIQASGLKKLTAIVLGFRISKGQQVTDWEAAELTEAQQIYAATDAWVCREIYTRLDSIN
ncbi:MAG: 3'-5' exonuclease domain-containing protein 2 [Bacteroidales bacterium]|jgi:ribonuclease D|nr:3'-5' exonuclease domain-containing protein 2 [Bacteroidales bacterium]